MGRTWMVVCAIALGCISLGLTLTALLTDHWYQASTGDNIEPGARQEYNFHFGLWKMCYEDGIPTDVVEDPSYKKDGSCVYIYKQLIQKNEGDLDSNSRLRIHLSRAVLGCSIACGAVTLAALLSLLCGLCRACAAPQSSKRPCIYLSASVLLLLATMCGIASGICFIALRDLDNTTTRFSSSSSSSSSSPVMPLPPALPDYVSQEYRWSFMLHWIGTGLALADSFLLLWLLHSSYEFVGEDVKWNRFSNI